jgi:Ca2+-binding EF-hand superfamily protein
LEPLLQTGQQSPALFITFVSFTLLCVMNVVTGIFCESAIQAAQKDRDHMIDLQLADRSRFVRHLQRLFAEWDSSGDGDLSLEEFEAHLSDTRMIAFFDTLDIQASDAWALFKLLDADGGGTIDADEFVSGCIRLRGDAKAVHMEKLNHEMRWLMDQVTQVQVMLTDHANPGSLDMLGSSATVRPTLAMSKLNADHTDSKHNDAAEKLLPSSVGGMYEQLSQPYAPARKAVPLPNGAPAEVMVHPNMVEEPDHSSQLE